MRAYSDVVLEALERRICLDGSSPAPSFTWKMEDRYGIDSNHNGLIDLPNSRAYADAAKFAIDLDPSGSQGGLPITKYQWTFTGAGLKKPLAVKSTSPAVARVLLPQGTFNVELRVTDSSNASASETQQITVRDYLIVALGDSYGSGEGNPEIPNSTPNKVKWADGVSPAMTRENFEAHRSTAAASSQAALLLEQSDPHTSVTYVNLCESGAEIPHGMLEPLPGRTHGSYSLPAQVAELRKIVGKRPIDALVLSIGGNDFGFTNFLAGLIQPGSTDADTAALSAQAGSALATLPGRYGQLAAALGRISVAHTLITAYPDLTQVAPGQFVNMATDVVSGYGISPASAQFASQVLLDPLNAAIQNSAAGRWQYIAGYLPDFLSHGYAAADPWFRTESEARTLQGAETSVFGLIPISDGGFHPNAAGLGDIAQTIYGALSADLT